MASVAVLGGGVGGLSAAHHLIEAGGFTVDVYERTAFPGGKARSAMAPPITPTGAVLPPLPGEHGFRLFLGFYRHLPDTMKTIPSQVGGTVAADGAVTKNLVRCPRLRLYEPGGVSIDLVTQLSTSQPDLTTLLTSILESPELGLDTTSNDVPFIIQQLLAIQLASDYDKLNLYEKQSWWDYIDAQNRNAAYQRLLGATRTVVAADPHLMSARTGGVTTLQNLLAMTSSAGSDQVLNGPTSNAWLDPWCSYLAGQGVNFHVNAAVTAIAMSQGSVSSVAVTGQSSPVSADYYIAALPVECMDALVTQDMMNAEPLLQNLGQLQTRIMSGIQYYLFNDVPIVNGHAIYLDSLWGLTSISQQQFWNYQLNAQAPGITGINGVLSVDVSDWQTPGSTGKSAQVCTRDEIAAEVWTQLQSALNAGGGNMLDNANRAGYTLDENLHPGTTTAPATSDAPLFINTVNSWWLRPKSVTRIPNLFLAADYVRTWTDLATMEGANEAARRAVNGILKKSGSTKRCKIWRLANPAWAGPLLTAANTISPAVPPAWLPD